MRTLSNSRVPAAAALKKADLSLVLTNNREIQVLNRNWRGKNKPTDVLSFPQHTPEELRRFGRLFARSKSKQSPIIELGDIVISLEKARPQAEDRGFSMCEELDWLLVHGLLHLLGYDHESSASEEKRMRRLELKVLEEAGWKENRLKALARSLAGEK